MFYIYKHLLIKYGWLFELKITVMVNCRARGATLQESVELYNPDNDAWFTCNNEPEFKGGLSMTSF